MKPIKILMLSLLVGLFIGLFTGVSNSQTTTITCPSGDEYTCIRFSDSGVVRRGPGTINGDTTID